MDWKCVLCFAIVGNKIRYRQLQLNDSKYNEIVFEFNGHLTGKYICVKCHKCVIELVKLRSDINDIKINLQQCEGKADDIREKLNSIRDRNRISPLPVATPVAITPNIGTDSTSDVTTPVKGGKRLHFQSPCTKKLDTKPTPVKDVEVSLTNASYIHCTNKILVDICRMHLMC